MYSKGYDWKKRQRFWDVGLGFLGNLSGTFPGCFRSFGPQWPGNVLEMCVVLDSGFWNEFSRASFSFFKSG